MTLHLLAIICCALYLVYSGSFYAEGHRAQGGPALKMLGLLFEVSFLSVLAWVLFA